MIIYSPNWWNEKRYDCLFLTVCVLFLLIIVFLCVLMVWIQLFVSNAILTYCYRQTYNSKFNNIIPVLPIFSIGLFLNITQK